jgi:hypothetical protein
LTGYGVPDDDMPDSFPPLTWGPPFDERNLDALLAGHPADTPLALRQVADALTALRAAPTPAELTGEAAARAEFRALADSLGFGLDEAARTDGHPYSEVLSALALDGAGRPPARHRSIRGARGAGRGRPARPHRARPPGRRLGRRGGVLMAAAGAALIVVVIALTGSLPGPIHSFGRSSAAGKSSPSPSVSPGSQNVQARSATPEPSNQATPTPPARQTPSPPHSSSAQSQADGLCRAFYSKYFLHAYPRLGFLAEIAAYQEIAKLFAYPPQFNLNSYCGQYVKDMFPQGLPRIPGFLTVSVPGPQDGPGNGQQGAGVGGPAQGTMNGIPVNN